MVSSQAGLTVAGLTLSLDARGCGVQIALPDCHAAFATANAGGDGLVLRVRDGPAAGRAGWRPVYHDEETWQLWRDAGGRYLFVAPKGSPPRRQVTVDAAFRSGEVTGDFGASAGGGKNLYPLADVDILIYVNWLAESGDLIVHAAGIDDDGVGYAFAGPSGAGKSTLAAEAAASPSVTVLGEDQVILRYLDGRFLAYGTPWHTDPARCSPGGVPLKKLFFLERAAYHGVEPCRGMAGIERLLQDAFIPYYNETGVARILDHLALLAEQVPFYTLSYQPGAGVMELARSA